MDSPNSTCLNCEKTHNCELQQIRAANGLPFAGFICAEKRVIHIHPRKIVAFVSVLIASFLLGYVAIPRSSLYGQGVLHKVQLTGTPNGMSNREYVDLSNNGVENRTLIDGLQRQIDSLVSNQKDLSNSQKDIVRNQEDMQKAIAGQQSETSTTRWLFGVGLSAIIGLGSYFNVKKSKP